MDRMNLHTKCYDSSKGYLNWPASAVRRSGWGSTLQCLRRSLQLSEAQSACPRAKPEDRRQVSLIKCLVLLFVSQLTPS